MLSEYTKLSREVKTLLKNPSVKVLTALCLSILKIDTITTELMYILDNKSLSSYIRTNINKDFKRPISALFVPIIKIKAKLEFNQKVKDRLSNSNNTISLSIAQIKEIEESYDFTQDNRDFQMMRISSKKQLVKLSDEEKEQTIVLSLFKDADKFTYYLLNALQNFDSIELRMTEGRKNIGAMMFRVPFIAEYVNRALLSGNLISKVKILDNGILRPINLLDLQKLQTDGLTTTFNDHYRNFLGAFGKDNNVFKGHRTMMIIFAFGLFRFQPKRVLDDISFNNNLVSLELVEKNVNKAKELISKYQTAFMLEDIEDYINRVNEFFELYKIASSQRGVATKIESMRRITESEYREYQELKKLKSKLLTE
jgi:hypothetical protein